MTAANLPEHAQALSTLVRIQKYSDPFIPKRISWFASTLAFSYRIRPSTLKRIEFAMSRCVNISWQVCYFCACLKKRTWYNWRHRFHFYSDPTVYTDTLGRIKVCGSVLLHFRERFQKYADPVNTICVLVWTEGLNGAKSIRIRSCRTKLTAMQKQVARCYLLFNTC